MIRHTESYKDLKICCYAISADEPEEIINRWLENVKPADYITVLITKTNNSNFAYFKEKQKLPEFKDKLIVEEEDIVPWRFDTARNKSMRLIPKDADILVCTDIDEIMIPEFWDDYRKCAFEHPDFTEAVYKYAGLGERNSSPEQACWYNKTSPNSESFHWVYPIHEVLKADDGVCVPYYLDESKVYLIHKQNTQRDRQCYSELMELRRKEEPHDIIILDKIARDLFECGLYQDSIIQGVYLYGMIQDNPQLTGGNEFFLHSLCDFLGSCYYRIGKADEAEFFYKQGLKANDRVRDCYINLAQMYADMGRTSECYALLDEMNKKVVDRPDWRHYPYIWDEWKPCQILGDAAYSDGAYDTAGMIMETAVKHMTTQGMINDAVWCHFFEDYNKCMDKLGKPHITAEEALKRL